MANKIFHSSTVTFLDRTDERKLEVYISSNHPTVQIKNQNTGEYTPDWSTTNLQLSADVFIDSQEVTTNSQTTINWYSKIGDTKKHLGNGSQLIVSSNVLVNNPIITYICEAAYQNVDASSQITFTRTDTGLNGTNGVDGTGVTILGSYDTVSALQTAHPTGNPGDAYIIGGRLYVWAVDDAQWEDVGQIQGPAGADGVSAKWITLSSSSQVFKVSNTGIVTPTSITVTATAINTSVSAWTYSTDGGKTFSSTAPAGLSRNGNTITITGSTLGVSAVVIKASDGAYGDTLTVHKVVDGATGAKGDSASMSFLTNENISFAANDSGQVSATWLTTNVVAYNGTEKVMPTVGTPSGMPSGMTISVDSTSLAGSSKEVMLTVSIANNATLGSALSNHGTITIPVTSPVSTNLILSWSKINSGSTGVGIKSVTEYYLATTVSSGVTISTTGWTTAIQTMTATNKYLWNYEVITYTNDTTSSTNPIIIGVFGNTGSSGTGIKSVTEYYLATDLSSGVTTSTTGWTTTIQTLTEINKYLWNYELITYTDNTTTIINPIIIGVYGDTGTPGRPGSDAVTFQVYSSNGYALSINTPTVTLQTFAYLGDVAITADATYQWYAYSDTGWAAISGETNAYLTITREDVIFSKSYMCKMMFNDVEYTSVATIDDKNDENKVFTTKPSNYTAGDIWIVGVDYSPAGIEVGTLLRAEHTNVTYEDADWVTSLKYDDKLAELEKNMKTYNQYFSFDSTDGLKISAKDDNGTPSQFSTSLTNERLSFNYGNEAIAYINGTKMNIKEAEIESPLTVTGKYSGSTMLQAPVINIGNFSIIVESNGSLSIVANT